MISSNSLPSAILEKMAAKDRPKGKAGWTQEKAESEFEKKSEREIQKDIKNLLSQKKVKVVLNPPMYKRSGLPVGWPDFTFTYRGKPVAIEVKIPGRTLKPEQRKCLEEMRDDGCLIYTAYSCRDVVVILASLDAGI